MNKIVRWLIIKKLDKMTKEVKEGKVKSGFFTSEFIITLIGGVVVAICQAFNLDPALQQKIVALVIAYITSRTVVKVGNEIVNGKKK